jgi:hypothetical protein
MHDFRAAWHRLPFSNFIGTIPPPSDTPMFKLEKDRVFLVQNTTTRENRNGGFANRSQPGKSADAIPCASHFY